MRRHTEEEIQAYFTPSEFEEAIGERVTFVLGFIFLFAGSFMGFMFYITGLAKLAGYWILIFPGIMGSIGLLLIVGASRSGVKKPSELSVQLEQLNSKEMRIRRIIREGQIIEANIDEVYENYSYRINGMPETTFFLSFGFEKIKFKTFSNKIILRYRYKEKMKIYYHKSYPDVIIPYDNIELRTFLNNFNEYRTVNIQ